MSKIVKTLGYTVNQRRRVKGVIANYHHNAIMSLESFDHSRKHRPNTTAIAEGSQVQQLVCDYIESGVSLTEATMMINWWCIKNDMLTVTRSAVYSCVTRMTSIVSLIKKRPQSQSDPNCIWAKCAAQNLIRFGEDLGEYLDLLREESGELPACFDSKLLPKLDWHAIGYWDVSWPHTTQ